MRTKQGLLGILLLFVVLTACKARSTATPSTGLPMTPISSNASPRPSNTMTPTMIAPPTPSSVVVTQVAIDAIEWATYVFDVGIAFEYPHDWIIMDSQEHEASVEFFVTSYLPYNVRVDVYSRPVEDKALADPHSWVPNEGNYEVLWEKPIAIEGAQGLEFIWGIPNVNQIGGRLIAIFYSEQHELEVRLSTDADTIPSESNPFAVFEHLVQSVQIAP